jgi:hypothetical protein
MEYYQVITATTYGNFVDLNPAVGTGQYNSTAYGTTGNRDIVFKKETNNGYFIVLCPQNNQICVYKYSNGTITTLFGASCSTITTFASS